MSKSGGNIILIIEPSGHKEFVLEAQCSYDIVCTYCTYVGAPVYDNIVIAIFTNIIPTIL